MARPLRLEYAGAVYHVMARGHERCPIYRDDEDRQRFLEGLARVVEELRFVVHGYCLMTNHYHLLIETPAPNLAAGMHRLNTRYSQSFNVRHGRTGHLLESRYKALLIEKESYLLELSRYVVLNPVRAGLVRSAGAWRWSNYRATCGEMQRPAFLEVDWTLGCFATRRTSAREAYRRFVSEGKGAADPTAAAAGQVFLGSPAFLDEMKRRLEGTDLSAEIPRAQREATFLPLTRICEAVAEEYGIPREALGTAWSRGEHRAVVAYLARKRSGLPAARIAEFLGVSGGRVSQLVRQVEESDDVSLAGHVDRVGRRLGGRNEGR
jgi:REP element-mobilizing transposase RayT